MSKSEMSWGSSRFRQDDRGAVIIIVAFALFALMALMAFAIDLGKQLRATAQAQATADAAALAGAGVLALTSDEAAARDEAKLFAKRNIVMGDSVDIADGDVIFYRSSGTDSVRVVVRRTTDAPDGPIATIFGKVLGIDYMEVVRDAIADVVPAGSAPCALPVGILDLWWEDSGQTERPALGDEYEPSAADDDGEADTYCSAIDASCTPASGYDIEAPAGGDYGTEVVLWDSNRDPSERLNPSWWSPWVKPGNQPGTAAYRNRITGAACQAGEDNTINFTEDVSSEPGKMVAQRTAWDDLLAQGDPSDVVWKPAGQCPNASFTKGCVWSPGEGRAITSHARIRPLPTYDPDEMNSDPGRSDASITNILGVFVSHWGTEASTGDDLVIGYLLPTVGVAGSGAPANASIKAIRLVE